MATPPPGREPFIVGTATIDKAPLLFHHLLDLAENMESHGLAAHAAAPLAVCELVARLCLGPPGAIPNKVSKAGGDGNTRAQAGGGEGGTTAAVAAAAKPGKGGGVGAGTADGEGSEHPEANTMFPALALACLRRSRLLLKLGPT